MHILDLARARGFLHEATPGLADRLAQGPVTAYVGFDPTADSLHVGNLVPVMALAWLQRTGGTPVALVGGGTGMVGDPSGKRNERPMLSLEQVEANGAAIGAQLGRFLDFTGRNAARLENNADWLRDLSLLEFLRDTGKHFTVNYMLQKESVRNRMESGISFTEFSYMLVQAHDYWHLNRTLGVELQMGGSDQWGNITAGIELIHRREGRGVHGLVLPLLTTATGAKFGKSEAGNVWLDPAKTSPYKFFQFWLNADDRDAGPWLRIFTFLQLEEIEALEAEHAADPGKRTLQRRLAREVTGTVHGADVAARVIEASAILFGGTPLRGAAPEVLGVLAGELPTAPVDPGALAAGVPLLDALVQAGLASSKGDARRGLQQCGFSVNGEPVGEVDRRLGADDLLADRYIMLQKGRKTYAMLVAGGAPPTA
jgi:tyrosyl-tRNA synthetase